MHLAVLFAQYLIVLPIALLLWGWLKTNGDGRRVLLLRGALSLILGIALAKGAGAIYDDPRPFVVGHFTPMISHAPDNGFPSDHSLLAFSCAFLLWPFHRRLSIVAALASAAIERRRESRADCITLSILPQASYSRQSAMRLEY